MPPLTAANDLIRSRNVTASECYALIGKHPYHTPQSIYDRLTAPQDFGHPESSEAMRIGTFLEPHVARYAATKLGLKVRANSRSVEHPSVNLAATPDYIVLGKPWLLEIKVSGITYGWTEDNLHPWIEYQARAQMACTNRELVMVCALVGSTFYQVPVVRQAGKEEYLLDAVDRFMHEHVLINVRPEAQDATIHATVTKS